MVRRIARTIAKVPELSRTGVALLLFLVCCPGRGLALDPSQRFSSYLRSRFSNEAGLPSSIVHEIVQSQDGFLWLSVGADTLTRFDGRSFTDISLPHARILAIAPDGGLWVGTDGGLARIAAYPCGPKIPHVERRQPTSLVRYGREQEQWVPHRFVFF